MKSKKTILFVAIVALSMISVPAFSQLKIGLKADVGINKPKFDETLWHVENLNGFKVGPTVEFMFPVVGLGVDASLLYNNERMNVKMGNVKDMKISNHYLDIPVNLKYKFGILSPVKVYLAAGPYAKIRVAGDEINMNDIVLQGIGDDDFENLIESRPIEAGINVGLGAEVINRVQLGFNYGIKLTDNFYSELEDIEGIEGVEALPLLKALNGKKGTWSITATVFIN